MPGTYIPVTNTEPWTEAEDERLRKAYKRYQHASNCWPSCAKLVGGRTREQCRYRWQEYLKPGVSRDLRWNDKEEETMIDHIKNNNRPSTVAFNELFPNRPYNFVRSQWRRVLQELERERKDKSTRSGEPTSPDKHSGPSRTPLRRGRNRRTARIDSDEESDPEEVVITGHVPAGPSQQSAGTSSTLGASAPQSAPQPAETGMATCAGAAGDDASLTAALTLFCAPPALVGPAARSRAQDFLVEECKDPKRSTDHQIRIAVALLRPTASEQARTLAEKVLLDSIHARVR